MQSIDGRSLRLGYDLQSLAHTCILGTCSCLRLSGIRPHGGDGDDVFDRGGAEDALRKFMLEN